MVASCAAGFVTVFYGIETPEPDALHAMSKDESLRMPILDVTRTRQGPWDHAARVRYPVAAGLHPGAQGPSPPGENGAPCRPLLPAADRHLARG